jgi:hypothetical protein
LWKIASFSPVGVWVVGVCRVGVWVGELGGVSFVVDTESEDIILAVSLESPPFPFNAEEIVFRIPGATAEVRFFVGTRGISFPGNSSLNYHQHISYQETIPHDITS